MIKKDHIADYCVITESPEHRLSQFERLTLVGGEDLEKALAWISKQFANFSYQDRFAEIDVLHFINAVDFYSRWNDTPEKFFKRPRAKPVVKETVLHGLADGEIADLNYRSAYRVHNPDFEPEFKRYTNNCNTHARHWRHNKQARSVMIAVHGWHMGDQRLNALAFLPGYFYSLGMDVVMFELPYHGRRAAGKNQGEFFPSANAVRTNEGMGQVISDLRELRSYLKAQGYKTIGCTGMSLGGYSSILWSSLDKLDFCIPIVPMVSMAEMAYEVIERSPHFAEYLKAGVSINLLKHLYHVHSPLNFKPKVARDRRFIIAGLGDEITSPRHAHMLWEHWDRPRIFWLQGGHAAQFKDVKVFYEIRSFLSEIGAISL